MIPHEYAPPKKVDTDNRLTETVLQFLDNRPAHYTFKYMAQHTGINAFRIQHLTNRRARDMYAGEALTLYTFFTGKQIEV